MIVIKRELAVLCCLFCSVLVQASGQAATLHYEGNSQVELFSSKGTRILIDVTDPGRLVKPATDEDVLLRTHSHRDHTSSFFLFSFNGRMIASSCDTKIKDVSIRGFPAPHNERDPFKDEYCTNYAFLVSMDGLRIVHLGDVGQVRFTREQLDILGDVDIAIMQFDNSYSDMNLNNKKGFNLMEQLKPRMIIPVHFSTNAAKHAATLWPCYYSDSDFMTVRKAKLPKGTCMVFLGASNRNCVQETKAAPINW